LSGIVEISGGPNHALSRRSDGTIIGWGYNEFGQATSPPGLLSVNSIEAAQTTSLAIRNDYTVYKWGGTFDSNDVPAGVNGIAQLDAGNQHVLALRTNGTVLAWGYNFFGQGTVPEEINGVTAIAAGGNHNLVVTARPRLNSITPPVHASISQPVTFTVTATDGLLSYQWQHRGTNLPGETSSSLMITQAAPENAGPYSVIVSNAYGSITASTALLLPPPLIQSQPEGRTVYRGEDVTLLVGASGFPPFTYQWMHSGTNLPGANASSLIVARVGPSRAGKYRVVVTDVAGGSVTSAEAEINVIDPRPKTVVLTPSMDTSIYSGGTKPQGNSTILSGRRGIGVIDRALLRFDLRAIPTNAIVQSAQLELSVVRAPNYTPYTFRLHRLLTIWDESANWQQAASGRLWAAPGGAPNTDFQSTHVPAVVGAGVSTFRGLFGPSVELQGDLQAWIQNPNSNSGWILICASEGDAKSARHFGSTESGFPPRLTISYEIPARIPEITPADFTQGSFALRVTPDPGWFYTIEWRENLDQGDWIAVTNIAAGAALLPISVPVPSTNPHQFFRAYRN
jgi:hypothetical protein